MNEQLQARLKQYASAPLLTTPEKEAYIKEITAQILLSDYSAEGMEVFITWWTNIVAFKMVADLLATSEGKATLGLIHDLQVKAEVLADNIDIAYNDLQIWSEKDRGVKK